MARASETPSESRMLHIRFSAEDHRRLRVVVAEQDTTIQEWVTALVVKELDRVERKTKR